MRRFALGDFDWRHNGENYLASYWTLPLQFEFKDPGWTIVLRTTKEGAFASIGDLLETFILGILASAGMSILMAIFQIRKRLVPVEKLQDGTRRIAQKDFAFQVDVRSGDEFEDLAESINTMATQLGHQFHMLSTKAEIDRAVLSLLDTEKIVETILTRLLAVFSCDMASLTFLNSNGGEANQIFFINRNSGFEPAVTIVQRSAEAHPNGDRTRTIAGDGQMLRAEITTGNDPIALRVIGARTPLVIDELEARKLSLEFLGGNGFRSIMAAPLIVKEEALGVLAFYSDESQKFADQQVDFLRGLASQAAIAIYNSQLFERTKHHALELQKANQAKDEFLSVMSHELRTPINVIIGYVRVIQEKMLGDINAEQSRALNTIEKHTNDLMAIIESIMEATKIEAGAVVIESQPVDTVNFLEGLKSQYALPITKQLTLHWHHSEDLPPVTTDELKLKRILQNLIGNAIKFTDVGRIDVSASYLPEQNAVEFKVSDTGIGIPEESHASIFEMFRQLDSSRTREFEGVGLGLYIVKKLCALVGAAIKVESQPGRGTTFTVRLPVLREEPEKRVA
jgi:signal transduction histidine kinase